MGKKRKKPEGLTVKHQGGPSPSGDGRNWVHFPVNFRGALHTYLTCQTISCMYLGILGTLAVNRSMLILYGSARLLPERERLKYDLKPSLADLRPTFQQDWDLCRSSLHVGWPGGPGRSLILKQICSGLLKAPLLKGRGSLLPHIHHHIGAVSGCVVGNHVTNLVVAGALHCCRPGCGLVDIIASADLPQSTLAEVDHK